MGSRFVIFLLSAFVLTAAWTARSSAEVNVTVGPYRLAAVPEHPARGGQIVSSETLSVERITGGLARRLFSKKAFRWSIDRAHPRPGKDITGDGRPDVVVVSWSGGAHCCYDNYIFELGDKLRVHHVASGDFPIKFVDAEPGGASEIIVRDTAFLYWLAPFSVSAAPRIIMRYGNDGFRVAPDLMREPALSNLALKQLAKSLIQARVAEDLGAVITKTPGQRLRHLSSEQTSRFLRAITDLTYGGNLKSAIAIIENIWPDNVAGKSTFLREFLRCRLPSSSYWPAIAQLNGIPATSPDRNCSAGPEGG